jgi:hypothetical protein
MRGFCRKQRISCCDGNDWWNRAMTLHHAAALALVGWYLMVPFADAPGKPPNLHAPLSQWNQMGAFDTAVACDKERESRRKLASDALEQVKHEIEALPDTGNRPLSEAAPKVYSDDVTASTEAVAVAASRCIASDDPRLKGN